MSMSIVSLKLTFERYFLMWTFEKVFIEFATILLLFFILCFGREAYGILAPSQGSNLYFLHWKAKS